MTIDEINAFIGNPSKFLVGDVEWRMPRGCDGPFLFRQTVQYDNSANRKIELNIWCHLNKPKITIAFFVAGIGRIYGFCLGVSHNRMLYHRHHGRKGNEVATPLPNSIVTLVDDPAAVWAEFCAETSLTHQGSFRNPPGESWQPQSTEI